LVGAADPGPGRAGPALDEDLVVAAASRAVVPRDDGVAGRIDRERRVPRGEVGVADAGPAAGAAELVPAVRAVPAADVDLAGDGAVALDPGDDGAARGVDG